MTTPALELLDQVGPGTAVPHVMTLYLEGEIAQKEWVEVTAQLNRYADRRVRHVVVDFTEVSHLDYRMVRPLIARKDSFRALGGDLKLSGLSPYLLAIFRSAGVYDAFVSYPSATEAVASYRK